jgi:hypothetical protein
MMAEEFREMRDLLIELRITLQHMGDKLDTSLVDVRQRMAQTDKVFDVRTSKLEERVSVMEQRFWYFSGSVAIIAPVLSYIIMKVVEQ